MAEKFYAEPGRVRDAREKLQLKQTAFEGVSDRIVRDMEAGEPVSIKSANKVAKCLGVHVDSLRSKAAQEDQVAIPRVDIRLSRSKERWVSPAYAVAAPELADMLEDSRDVRFLTYGQFTIDGPRRDALAALEAAVADLRNSQMNDRRMTMVESINQMIQQRSNAYALQDAIDNLMDQGVSLLATNVVNEDWYRSYDPYEDDIPGDFDPDEVRKRLTWMITAFIFTPGDLDCINVVASHFSKSAVLDDDIPF